MWFRNEEISVSVVFHIIRSKNWLLHRYFDFFSSLSSAVDIINYRFSAKRNYKPLIPKCCDPNEEVITNSNKCLLKVRNCDYNSSEILKCKRCIDPPFCACKKGYFRNKCGECVLKKFCDVECYTQQPIICPAPNQILYGCHVKNSRLCPHLIKRKSNSNHCFLSKSLSSFDISWSWSLGSRSSNLCNCRCSKSNLHSYKSKHQSRRRINYCSTPPKKLPLISLNRCDCKPGYYLNICDQCVLLEHCKDPCCEKETDPCSDPNAERKKCFRKSEMWTCKHVNKGIKPTPDPWEKCTHNLCVCKAGYALDDTGRCVLKSKCHYPSECTCPCDPKTEEYRYFNGCNERTCSWWEIR